MLSKFFIVLLTVMSFARAQEISAANPDYSGINDILNGRRTLLSINDLVIGGSVLKTSDGTKIDDKNISGLPGFQRGGVDQEILARVFDSKSGTLVYANHSSVHATDPASHGTTSLTLNDNFNYRFMDIASGDFRGDGYQEVVLVSHAGLRVVGAVDPKDFSKGLYVGPRQYVMPTNGGLVGLAVGDFDGDGHPEVALAYDAVYDAHERLNIYRVDPKTLALVPATGSNLGRGHTLGLTKLVAARFASTSHDQLLLAYDAFRVGTQFFKSFDFNRSLNPILKDTRTISAGSIQELSLGTGRFDPVSPYDQAAVKVNRGPGNVQFGIISFDSSLKIHLPAFVTLPGVACSSGGLAVGDFARTEPVPQDPSKTQPSLKFQLALSSSNCAGSLGVNIYNVDPPAIADQDFVINTNAVLSRSLPQTADYGLPIIAGDIQGRSVILGEPTKVAIEDTAQPSVIAAMPPMHVDFVPPSRGEPPTLLNLSAIPNGFRTVYETSETNTAQSSTTNTSSWSFGAEVNVGASVEIGSVENGLGVEIGATAQAAQDIKTINEKQYGSYQSSRFDASVATGFSDQVWYTQSRFNVYVYPVLGHTVCPKGKANCTETEKVPLTIQFSGPDKVESHKVDGNLIPWYQPPWEPGNVFSYPATEEQLQKILPNTQQLSKANTYRTDSGTATERATWTSETTEGATASVDQNFSYELGFSVSGAVSGGFVTGKASASLNLSGSSGFSDLNKSVTSVGRSDGIGVEKPGTFRNPASYNYLFTPYILGQMKPGTVVDNQPLQADVKTFGLLRTAFTADPARDDAGGWWRGAYRDKPDVALNHPSRWTKGSAAGPLQSNCLESSDGLYCIALQPSRPDNLWDSNFHVMRGFFISNAVSGGKGPQLTTATAGDKLRLEARVYNYSFKAMPVDSQVHVRFYAQQIDTLNGHRPVGDSVLINEVKLAPIPPFSDDDDQPLNWVLAKTDFDTTGYDAKYLVFWVVVWIEDANGNLVPETEGHGLTKIPGDLKSLAGVEPETYSNNVGFYNSAFYVFPDQSVTREAVRDGEPASFSIADTRECEKRTFQGQTLDITAKLTAQNNSASGVTALFYDGDPHDGGTVFGLERIPYIAENGTYQVEAPYHAGACGKHELFVVVHEGTPDEVLSRIGKVKVDCAR